MQNSPTTLSPLQASTLTMEAYRRAAFRTQAALRFSQATAAGISPANTSVTLMAEQRALAQAIMDPEWINIASQELLRIQAQIINNPRYQITPEHAHEAVWQIMSRRAAEADQFAQQLAQPDYVAQLTQLSPTQAIAEMPSLRDVKVKEVLGELLHSEHGVPPVIAHIDAAAKGTMISHDALATLFSPTGALRAPLIQTLHRYLPTSPAAQIETLATDWLEMRAAAASMTSAVCTHDGDAFKEAVRQSELYHRQPSQSNDTTLRIAQKSVDSIVPEKEKTAQQQAEDVAYTINHALSCGTTDIVLQPLIAAAIGINTGCDPHHKNQFHTKQKLTFKAFAHEAGHYLKGEIFGDFVAVPLTIAVQRLFPNFMNGIRKLTEPLLGWAFRSGANRTARHWARENGLAPDAPEVKAHALALYTHEIEHVPQAIVWNLFAYPIGAVGQKMGGHGRNYPEIFKSKLVGAIISNGILIGGRMVAPGAAQKWDTMMGSHVFLPASQALGKLFGVNAAAMEKAASASQTHAPLRWSTRVEEAQIQPIGTAARG